MDEKQLEEHLKSLQIDQRNMAKVIADTTRKTVEEVDGDMNSRTTLSPTDAQAYGLVHEIKTELLTSTMQVITIGESIQGQPYGLKQFTVPNMQVLNEPSIDTFTENNSVNITT